MYAYYRYRELKTRILRTLWSSKIFTWASLVANIPSIELSIFMSEKIGLVLRLISILLNIFISFETGLLSMHGSKEGRVREPPSREWVKLRINTALLASVRQCDRGRGEGGAGAHEADPGLCLLGVHRTVQPQLGTETSTQSWQSYQ